MTLTSTTLTLNGFLQSINHWNQLLISLKDEDLEKCEAALASKEGRVPLVKKGEKTQILYVSLTPKDKNVKRYFDAIASKCGSYVTVDVELKEYDFENSDKERKHGWKATLKSIK